MKKVISTLARVQIAAGGIFLFIFLIAVVYQMVTRYLGIAATWIEDIEMYSFIWAVFMGAGAMVFEERHFAFTSISDAVRSKRGKALLSLVIHLVMLSFAVLMLIYGVQVAKQFWNYTWTNIPSFKRGPTWLCLPICGASSAIYLLYHLSNDCRSIMKGDK